MRKQLGIAEIQEGCNLDMYLGIFKFDAKKSVSRQCSRHLLNVPLVRLDDLITIPSRENLGAIADVGVILDILERRQMVPKDTKSPML